MCPKVAYHGMPCLWEHENALQRSQDKKTNMRCEDRRKRRWKTVVEKPPLRVSQICAQLRRACHKYVPTPVIGLRMASQMGMVKFVPGLFPT